MKRDEQRLHNQKVIEAIPVMFIRRYHPPPYKVICATLNRHYRTSYGNKWTPKRLFRMLQRNGFSGLHGLFTATKAKEDNKD